LLRNGAAGDPAPATVTEEDFHRKLGVGTVGPAKSGILPANNIKNMDLTSKNVDSAGNVGLSQQKR